MRLKEVILLTANYYGRTLNEQVLGMYADDLAGYDEGRVIEAYKTFRRNPKNKTFPLPAQIIEILEPQISVDTQAHEIVSRIVQSISKFGYVGHRHAQPFIGEVGWAVVRRLGGWEYLCREHGDSINPGQFYAQTRELIKSQLEIQNTPNVDMSRLLNGPEKVTSQLPAPVQFSEKETEKIAQLTQGQPRELVENFLQALAKQKSMNPEETA